LPERSGQQRKPLAPPASFAAKDEDMRDFRDAKAMARTLREALAAGGLRITVGESLELVAKLFGVADWNTLSAAIAAQAAASEDRPAPAPPAESSVAPSDRVGFSADLERTLHSAVAAANHRKYRYATLEHLLLSLIDDADASVVLKACGIDLDDLRTVVTRYVDDDLKSLVESGGEPAAPTAGFQRVIQRAVIHVRASGRDAVTGANVLVAVFSEPESRACAFLLERAMTRYDAVNFIAHGIRKSGEAA
jgi:hypothetical protein